MRQRREREDGQKTREAILAAAAEEFSAKGFELGSMRAICANAGANSALACRYFGSKEELYKVVAKRLFGDLGAPLANLAKGVTNEASWRTAVREWIDDFLFMTIPTEKAQRHCAGLFRHARLRQAGLRRAEGAPGDGARRRVRNRALGVVRLGAGQRLCLGRQEVARVVSAEGREDGGLASKGW